MPRMPVSLNLAVLFADVLIIRALYHVGSVLGTLVFGNSHIRSNVLEYSVGFLAGVGMRQCQDPLALFSKRVALQGLAARCR